MYSPFRHIPDIVWKRRPIHLTFFVTRRCNSGCPFCFYLRSNEAAGSAPELSLSEIGKVSSSLGNLLWLAFSGGEIFLRDDLADIARVFYRNNKPSIMLFPTNGLLPDVIRSRIEEILRSCPQSVIALKLSIDGLGAKHDTLRNTAGSFEKTMATYEAVSGLLDRYSNFELGVNTVFCADNQSDMDAIIEHVQQMKNVKTHTISLVRGNLKDKHFGEVDEARYNTAVQTLAKNLREGKSGTYRFRGGRIKAAQDILQRRLIHHIMREQRRIIPCYAGRLNLVLSETGEVFPCEILNRSFGNIREHDYDLRKILRTKSGHDIQHFIKANGCSCTHECYFMTNILFNPGMYPALLKEYLRLRSA